ncbi:MAG TPA: tripartite tricarboxylate transporter substrate-binding protein [Ramlibacter sp.]|nr:tripartite tricarboxylate transporter substrate-binding protein [Ramlibacter sp.]
MDRRQFLAAAAASAAVAPPGLRAQALPGSAFIITAFPPGGAGDLVARPLAERLRGRYASNVLVDAKPGAGGRIAIDFVKRAAPDGLTILQIPTGTMTLYPSTYRKLNYDPFADFTPVTTTVPYDFSFTAGSGLPAEVRTVADYLQWAKANPRQANYGVPSAGSALHFAGMMLSRASGVPLQSIAYKGGSPLLNDVLGGQVPVSFNVLGEVLPHVRSGKLRSLAVTTARRSPFLPDVPTLVEQGFPDVVASEYLAWFVPARTPADTVRRLNALVRESLQDATHVESMAKVGLRPLTQSPEEFAQLLRTDAARWASVVKATGFSADEA